jgi:putative nucleotidyltransferase with HDIG domain
MVGVSTLPASSRRAELRERVAENLLARIEKGTLPLPSMPAAAVSCFELLRKADFAMHDAATVIEADPALAVRVLSVSHSVAFRAKQKARSVLQSITQLGANNLRLVLFEAMAAPIYESSDARIRKACRVLWRHSRAVASSARLAALHGCAGDPSEAYLGGLLHDVGKPMIASLLVKSENRLVGKATDLWLDHEAWLEVVEGTHRTVGVALARKWHLAESIVESVANAASTDPAGPIVDCVRLANALAKESAIYTGAVDGEAVAAAIDRGREALGMDDEDVDLLRSDLSNFGVED